MLRSLLVGILFAFTRIQFDTVCDVINSLVEWILPDSVWQAQQESQVEKTRKGKEKVDEKMKKRGWIASRNADCEPAS
jgi:hypothetical protein